MSGFDYHGRPTRTVDFFVPSLPGTPLRDFYPHYSDRQFSRGQVRAIYQARGLVSHESLPGLSYRYSDRLMQADYDKHEAAWVAASDKVPEQQSAAWVSAYLSAYFDRPTECRHILVGVNVSNGFPYQVFGYAYLEEKRLLRSSGNARQRRLHRRQVQKGTRK